MSRHIKFRAWDKKERRMFVPVHVKFDGKVCEEDGGTYHVFKPEEVILMQFTGLHDKDGEEIFEGDVVRIEGELVEIKYAAPNFCGQGRPKEDPVGSSVTIYNLEYRFSKTFEIVGNVHEHPELLK